ncbi:MAG: AAA family ATPase [Acidobacteriota bacterium]
MTAVDRILDTARRGELHHAIILHGPAPDALRQVAVSIAKALNCLEGTTGDECASCTRIERRIHPDVHFIEVAGEKKLISIEQIRDLLEGASMRPYEGRNKVFLIDPADALSTGGSNALLKTLEEPTRNTTFVLLTRSPDLLLPTIRSRSQALHVGGVATVNLALRSTIDAALKRFADQQDATALLALAATVSAEDDLKDSIALLASALCQAVADGSLPIAPERLLAAADGCMTAMRWLAVNADPKLLVEQALSELVVSKA